MEQLNFVFENTKNKWNIQPKFQSQKATKVNFFSGSKSLQHSLCLIYILPIKLQLGDESCRSDLCPLLFIELSLSFSSFSLMGYYRGRLIMIFFEQIQSPQKDPPSHPLTQFQKIVITKMQ